MPCRIDNGGAGLRKYRDAAIEERIHRRERWTKVAQGHRARLHGEGEIAEILEEAQPVIGGLRLGEGREPAILCPIEPARFDDDATQRIAVPV